ncbi:M50 family metallopeptidase [Strepomyces sp. STD 3.1]|uniref:M50 family metallopeptidase n=1 Tax=Streptomyces sp. NPDC058985 TaxID=3346684 RepID=UPI001F2C439F|nr:M50 family metallopeptidase [Streptomyces sp. STD 3.1]
MSPEGAEVFTHRPRLRPDVLLSAPLLRGPATVHLIRDPANGSAFEVGPKEYFLISRLDGERSLEEIGDEYASAFGRRLGEANWRQLLGLLGTKRLLAGAPPREVPTTPPTPSAPSAPSLTGNLYRGSLRLVADAGATTGLMHRALRPLWHRQVLLPLLVLCLAMEAVLAAGLGTLVRDTWWLFHQPVALLAVFTLLWLSTGGHELAHGVAARHHGGTVSEIGLRWRLPVAIMYCRVDDYRFLRSRWHQLAIGAAGAFANLLFLLPFAVWWAALETGDPTRRVLSGLLLLGSVQALVNLLPLPPLDGYTMLSHVLGVSNYAPESGRYLRLRLRDRQAAAGYPRRARVLYMAYGIGSSVLVCLIAAASVTAVFVLLAP